jgi:PAS domain S-box-containing protein
MTTGEQSCCCDRAQHVAPESGLAAALCSDAVECLRIMVEMHPDHAVYLVDEAGRIASWNPAAERLTGYTAEDALGQPLSMLYPPDESARFFLGDLLAQAARTGRVDDEGLRLRKDGSSFWAASSLTALRSREKVVGFVRVTRDVSERQRLEREREELVRELGMLNLELEQRVRERTVDLTRALEQRDVLLRELHHRVKNNLQVIKSLLSMHARKLRPSPCCEVLEQCQRRVQAMALIHEQLFVSADCRTVPFKQYIRGLAANLLTTADASKSIALELSIEEVALPLDTAVPCGLILNELVTNALKHAFEGRERGTIRVEVAREGEDRLRLTVEDDGVGLNSRMGHPRSLGLQIVRALAEQLRAELSVRGSPGASFELCFSMGGI